jgi:hypothetical protein
VKPLEPGFKTVLISPTFENLNHLQGIFPSVKGDIRVEWTKTEDQGIIHVELLIQIPDEIEGGIYRSRSLDGKLPTNIVAENNLQENSQGPELEFTLISGSNHFAIDY